MKTREIEITNVFHKTEKGVPVTTFIKMLEAEMDKAQTGRWPIKRGGMKIKTKKGMYGSVKVYLEGISVK